MVTPNCVRISTTRRVPLPSVPPTTNTDFACKEEGVLNVIGDGIVSVGRRGVFGIMTNGACSKPTFAAAAASASNRFK